MANILHYIKVDGNEEYIVITEEDLTDELKESWLIAGYEFDESYEIEDVGILPVDEILEPRR